MPAIACLRLGRGGPGKAGHLGAELRWDLGPAGGLGRVFRLRLVQVEPARSCLPFPDAHTTCNGLVRRGLQTAEGAFALPGTSLSLERSKASFPRPQVPWTRGRVWPHGHQMQSPSRTAWESASSCRTENRRRLKACVAQGRCSLSRCWLCSRPHCSVSLRKIRNWKSLIEKKKKVYNWKSNPLAMGRVGRLSFLCAEPGTAAEGFRGVPGAAGLPAESHRSLSVCTQKPPRLSSCT